MCYNHWTIFPRYNDFKHFFVEAYMTGGYHKQNQKKIRKMRRQGCKV